MGEIERSVRFHQDLELECPCRLGQVTKSRILAQQGLCMWFGFWDCTCHIIFARRLTSPSVQSVMLRLSASLAFSLTFAERIGYILQGPKSASPSVPVLGLVVSELWYYSIQISGAAAKHIYQPFNQHTASCYG